MQVIRKLPLELPLKFSNTILTIGSYDGIHRGHKKIINHLKARAAARENTASVMVTFFPRPKVVLGKAKVTEQYLTSMPEKIWLLEKLGLDIIVWLPFTKEFAQTPAEDFVTQLVEAFHPLELWVGPDFHLGRGREGNLEHLAELGEKYNYELKVISEELSREQVISSTRIRAAMSEGRVDDVTRLLGAYPFLRGEVEHGQKRGRTIGFPTANITVPQQKLLPVNGVYAVWITVDGKRYSAVANIGIRPTFDGEEHTVEIYIFDFSDMIYGKTVHVEWVKHLRPEQKFTGVNALIAQIKKDVVQAKEILSAEDYKGSY